VEGPVAEPVVATATRGGVSPIVEVGDDSDAEAESAHARSFAAGDAPPGDAPARPLGLYMGNAA